MTKNLEMINLWFEKTAKWVVKYRWFILVLFIILNVVAILGLPRVKQDTSIEGWLLENDPLRKATQQFEDLFGNNDFVALLIEAEDVFAPEVLAMIRNLGDELEKNVPYADKVISLTDLEFSYVDDEEIYIEDLIPDPIPQNQSEIEKIRNRALAKDQLVNQIFSDDSKQAWLMMRLYPFPDDWEEKGLKEPNSEVGDSVLSIVQQDKYQKFDIKATGMPIIAIEEVRYFEEVGGIILVIGLVVAILLLIVLLRSVRGFFIPLITMVSAIILVFGIMGYLGIKVQTVISTVPVFLGMAVSIGYSIHIFNFYKRYLLGTGKRKESVYHAMKECGWPLFFTALTTMASLLAFYFIDLTPIRWLGLTSAAVIVSVYLIAAIITPILLSFGKDKKPVLNKQGDVKIWSDKYFIKFGKWVLKYSLPIVIIYIITIGIFIYGITGLTINVDMEHSYGNKVPYVNRMNYISKTKLGSWGSYDVTFKFSEPDKIKDPEVLKRFEKFEQHIEKSKYTKRTSSILDIIKDMNQLLNEDNSDYYRIPDNQNLVAQLLLLYEMSGGTEASTWTNSDYTILRVMIEVVGMDAKEIVKDLASMEEKAKELFPDAELGVAGSLPQFAALNDYVAIGQIKSFLVALVVIMILMMLVFRSIKTGLIGMIPNITPAITVAGLLGLFRIPLDFYTITIIPMILGLAVDDTIHFITHAKVESRRLNSYEEGTFYTFKTVGKSLFMASFILVCSFSVYMVSDAKMLFNLGVFIVAGISSALIADYLITPVLINWTKPFNGIKNGNNNTLK